MPSRLRAVTFDARDPARLAAFWAGVLGRDTVDDRGGVLLPGSETQLGLRFVASPTEKVGQNPVHLHLTSTSAADQERAVATAIHLGARHLDVGQLPEEAHVVLADPEGNELCVIEPGNGFLAGCGLLGELTCEGTRDVGLFWAGALGWPLVWDDGRQTAVQSPLGGTKVSWDEATVRPRAARNRQRFDLDVVDGDLTGEIERLVALGAARLGRPTDGQVDGAVDLADPDGNEFRVAG